MGLLKELAKAGNVSTRTRDQFSSASFINTKTNILSKGGKTPDGGGVVQLPTRELSCWLGIIDELKAYEMFDLIQNIMKLIMDYVSLQIDSTTTEYFSIEDDQSLNDRLNKFIESTKITQKFKNDIYDIVYYGNKAYVIHKIDKGSIGNSFLISDITEPYKVSVKIEVSLEGDEAKTGRKRKSGRSTSVRKSSNFIIHGNGKTYQVSTDKMISFGRFDFKLIDDSPNLREDTVSKKGKSLNELTSEEVLMDLIDNVGTYGTKSIFYSLTSKIKDYLVKDVLSNVLSIKDVLTPILLKLGVDVTRATDTAELSSTINEIESKINDAVDESIVQGGTLGIDEIIRAVFSTVKLIPDPGNFLSNIDEINMTPIKDKFNQIREERDTAKENVMESLGIPPDLFDGGSNQYEVLTRSQRYETTVSTLLDDLKTIYITNCVKLCDLSGNFSKEEMRLIKGATCNLFKVSSIELTKKTKMIEQQQELAQSVQNLIDSYGRLIEDSKLINKEVALSMLKASLNSIDPELGSMILDELPNLEEDDDGFGSKGGRYGYAKSNKTKDTNNEKRVQGTSK